MITEKACGEDLTNEKFTSDPKRLARRLAEELRKLHELDFSDCPIKDRSTDYIATVEENFKKGIFDPELTSPIFPFSSREEAYSVFSEYKSLLKRNVLLHGDYCLPNVLFNEDFSFSSFIDVGNGGVGDRHIDVFWGSWTLWFNLKTDKYRDYFIDCYGKDLIDPNMLRAVAAAETFG
jgi:kanamycin kinase